MPLVDPITNSAAGDKNAEWQKKLVGKKIGDTHDEVVCAISSERRPMLIAAEDLRQERSSQGDQSH